jgi:prevent-host-death family protein
MSWTLRGPQIWVIKHIVWLLFILYNLCMNKISSTKARQNWADTVEKARDEPIVITEHGRETVVVMDAALAKLALQVLEDAYDVEQATKALEEFERSGISFTLEEVAAELGIELG